MNFVKYSRGIYISLLYFTKGTKFMYDNKTCGQVKLIAIFALIFLIIALVIFIIINNPVTQQKDILVATAASR